MASNLLLCISQKENTNPYKFMITNINVYSFEEALYHCYYYWKQSIEDFMSDEFITWVSETLKLSYLASKIKSLEKFHGLSRKLTGFMSLTDYFSYDEIESLRREVLKWENRREWEKLKEHGDFLINNKNPEKALHYYQKAAKFGDNAQIYNNIAICFMKMERYSEAMEYLDNAIKIRPNDYTLMMHITEAYILNGDFENAQSMLKNIASLFGETDKIQYFYGEISFYQKDYVKAASYYENIVSDSIEQDVDYIYRLCDTYMKMRQYNKALKILDKIRLKDKMFLKKQAEIYAAFNDFPRAIKSIEEAISKDTNSVSLWVKLAQYNRLDYNVEKAEHDIKNATKLSSKDMYAKLENAKIKKASGKMKEYQVALKEILSDFKMNFRENEYERN